METSDFLDVFVSETTVRGRERRESGYSCDETSFYSGCSTAGSDCGESASRRDSGNYLRPESYDSGVEAASPSSVQIFNIDLDLKDQTAKLQTPTSEDTTIAGSTGSSAGSTGSPPRRKKKRKRILCESLSVTHFNDVYRLTGEVLGEGSYGRVEGCTHIHTGQEYAVKIISKQSWHFSRPKILKEIELYYLCQGRKEIIQMVEYFEEASDFYLVFEKANGGPLLGQIQRRDHFTEQEAAAVIRDLASALAFLHGKGIAHRDLKPENVLCVGNEGDNDFLPIKLCDFDLCSAVYQTISTPKLQSPVGSVEYMAPEVVQAFAFDMDIFDYDSDEEDGLELSYDKRCDLWSLGIIAYVLLCGHLPFRASCGRDCGWEDRGEECAECQHQLFSAIKSGDLEFPEETWSEVSMEAKDLIRQLLIRDASQRIKASAVLDHPWIKAEGNCQPSQRQPMQPSAASASAASAAAPPPASSRPLDTPHVLKRCHRSVHDLLYSELGNNSRSSRSNNRSSSSSTTIMTNALALKLAKDQASTAIQIATAGMAEAEVGGDGGVMKKSATVIEFKQSANVDIVTRRAVGNSNHNWNNNKLSFCNATTTTATTTGGDGASASRRGGRGAACDKKVMRRQASLIVFPEDLATNSLSDLDRRWEF